MIKKHGLLNAIRYYCIIQHLLFALALYFTEDYLFEWFRNLSHITVYSPVYKLYSFLFPVFLIMFWTYIFFFVTREKMYRLKTGRAFSADNRKYKRSYTELVDYFHNSEPNKLDTSIFPLQSWKKTSGIVLGTDKKRLITLPSDCESNFAVYGPPGSGKSSGIAIPNAICFDGSVLAVDIKGDIYNYVSKHSDRRIIRFCPDNVNAVRESFHFDPLAGFKEMNITDQKLFLQNMATVLISDEGNSDNNYFVKSARKMFQGITFLILHYKPTASFPEIVHMILQGNIFDWVKRAIDSDCTLAKEQLASLMGNNEKNVSGSYDALSSALINYSNPVLDELLRPSSNCISSEYLENGYDIYLQIDQEHLDAYAPLFTLIIQSFSTAFTKRPDNSSGIYARPILMLLDEFPQLTFSYKLISSNLSTLRSKRIIIMIIQQNLAQLQYRYHDEGSRAIIGNCNYQIILGSNDINSSKVFSDMFGEKKVLKIGNSETVSQNNSVGKTVHEAKEKVFEPQFFGTLSKQKKMVIYFSGEYALCDKINCYN